MISLDSAVFSGFEAGIKQYALSSIRELSSLYGFDYNEAVAHLNLEKIEISKTSTSKPSTASSKPKQTKAQKQKKPDIELPFCGSKLDGFCSAIKKSYGLYNQCTKATNNTYCTVCQKQADKNSTNKPNLGDISDRIEQGDNWSDPTGKKPVKYAKVMAKLNISKETAMEVAETFGITIPETEFSLDKVKKGRPKKSVSADDTDDEKEKKKRGRPTKEKQQEEKTPGDDLIASLIEEAKQEEAITNIVEESKPKKKASAKKPKKKASEKKPKKKASTKKPKKKPEPEQQEPDSELDEEEAIEVKRQEINGNNYLVDQNGVVYDEDQNEVGTYNETDGTITYINDEEE